MNGSRPKFNAKWWTKVRVDNGLERFIRDFYAGREEELPTNIFAYQKLIPEDEKNRNQKNRMYPPAPAVLRYYESFVAAWWNFGFLVEVRSAKLKWVITPEIEETLRKIYDESFKGKERPADVPPGPKAYARQIGYPEHTLTQAAIRLGLSRAKEPTWSKEEIELLDKYGYRSVHNLVLLFKERGFKRSETGIMLMRKRRMSHKASPFYSMNAVAHLFGIDAHTVKDWINKGYLKYEMKGTLRDKNTSQNGDTYLIHKDWIYEFIVTCPNEFQIKKVDQLWFLHIVTKGEIRLSFSDDSKASKRTEGQLIEAPVEWKAPPRKKSNSKTESAELTWTRINWLLKNGFTKKSISAALGSKSQALQINKNRVRKSTAEKVRILFNKTQLKKGEIQTNA